MIGVGFEPTPPKRLVPKTSALDRSAIQPKTRLRRIRYTENGTGEAKRLVQQKNTASIGTRTRILSLEGINTTLVLWTLTLAPVGATRKTKKIYFTKDKKAMRRPGIKPGSRPWQGRILSLYYRRGSYPYRGSNSGPLACEASVIAN